MTGEGDEAGEAVVGHGKGTISGDGRSDAASRQRPPGLAPRGEARPLACRRDRRREGDPDQLRGEGAAGRSADRVHGRPRSRSEGRPHVALPRALRGGDRRGRDRRGVPRRGARGAHRGPHRRAPAGSASPGSDLGALPDRAHDAGHGPAHAGDGEPDRHRGSVRGGRAAARRRRGVRDQRLSVRPGPRARPRERAAARGRVRRRRRRAHPRARPACDAQPARPGNALRRHDSRA